MIRLKATHAFLMGLHPSRRPLASRACWRFAAADGRRLEAHEGAEGETRIGSLIGWTFSVEPRGEGFAMVYRPPFSAFVDEVRVGPGDSWVGSSLLNGREFGRFRMRRIEGHRHCQASEEENMVD
jgi:hypothetical protein